MKEQPYRQLVAHYERCFAQYGATAKGVDWPNEEDMAVRFRVMLGIAERLEAPVTLLDFGCGYGALYDHIRDNGKQQRFDYRGIDLSIPMIESAKARHPGVAFEVRDILASPLTEQSVDITVMNGVLTEKRELSLDTMEAFAVELITAAYAASRIGVAFNVMSAHVDWQRDELFHWPFDRAASLLKARCSRHVVFRADYGLYEYTVYLLRNPNAT
jgi:SAM-dependent methyltransferase